MPGPGVISAARGIPTAAFVIDEAPEVVCRLPALSALCIAGGESRLASRSPSSRWPCVLVARHLSHASWPLHSAHVPLAFLAGGAYLASFGFGAFGWQRLFPACERPDGARCLAACGAAAASGVVLPFRLDYVVKISTLRRLGGVRIGLETVAVSIVALGSSPRSRRSRSPPRPSRRRAALGLGGSLLLTLRARRPLSAWAPGTVGGHEGRIPIAQPAPSLSVR